MRTDELTDCHEEANSRFFAIMLTHLTSNTYIDTCYNLTSLLSITMIAL